MERKEYSAEQIFNTIPSRIKALGDTLREKMIIGSNEYKPSDLNIFFKDKQLQSEKVTGWTEKMAKIDLDDGVKVNYEKCRPRRMERSIRCWQRYKTIFERNRVNLC